MRRAIKFVCIVCAIPLVVLISCVALDQIPHSRATPPKTVTDVASCLVWLKNPIDAYKITTDKAVYYQIRGPAGRYLPSGCSAYSFNERGEFIGWTQDDGDYYEPREVYAPDAKAEKISLDELKRIFKL
jgi:hypothetical protein